MIAAAGIAPILYAEDEEDDVLLMRFAFKRTGIICPLCVVMDGKAVLERLLGRHDVAGHTIDPLPRLLLLDLNLPQVNGFEVLQRLRKEAAFVDFPVIILSSSQQPSDQARARALGADEFVVKPSNMDGWVNFAQSLRQHWLSRECVT